MPKTCSDCVSGVPLEYAERRRRNGSLLLANASWVFMWSIVAATSCCDSKCVCVVFMYMCECFLFEAPGGITFLRMRVAFLCAIRRHRLVLTSR